MRDLKIAVDIDGVLRDFVDQLILVYKYHNPGHTVIPKEYWSEYPLDGYFPIGKGIYPFFQRMFIKEVYLDSPTYPGARDFIDTLTSFSDVTLLSYQPNKKIEEVTLEWLTKNGIVADRVRFTKDKSKYKFHYVLDDCTKNLEAIRDANSAVPIAMDSTWNQDWTGQRVYSYDEFVKKVRR